MRQQLANSRVLHRSLLTSCSFPRHVVPVNKLCVRILGKVIFHATSICALKPQLSILEQLHHCIMDQVFDFAGIAQIRSPPLVEQPVKMLSLSSSSSWLAAAAIAAA